MSWYVEGMLPDHGCINLLAGNTHAGKTTMLYELVKSWKEGRDFLGLSTARPEYIGAILADRALVDNTLWLRAKQEGLFDHAFVTIESEAYMANVEADKNAQLSGAAHFAYCLSLLPRQSNMVLLVDVFTSTFIGDPERSATVKRNMDLINHTCHKNNICIIGTGYGSKQLSDSRTRYERYIDRMIGAAPLRGGASTVAYLATTEESSFDGFQSQVLEIVPRDGPPIRKGVRLDPSTRRFHEVKLERVVEVSVKPQEERACYEALDYIMEEATDGAEAYEAYKGDRSPENTKSPSRFRGWLAELDKLGEIENCGRGEYKRKVAN